MEAHDPRTYLTDGEDILSIPPAIQNSRRRFSKLMIDKIILIILLFLFSNVYDGTVITSAALQPPADVSAGVSMKPFRRSQSTLQDNFAWNSTELSWQRTSFHFQPPKNWMNGTIILFYA